MRRLLPLVMGRKRCRRALEREEEAGVVMMSVKKRDDRF